MNPLPPTDYSDKKSLSWLPEGRKRRLLATNRFEGRDDRDRNFSTGFGETKPAFGNSETTGISFKRSTSPPNFVPSLGGRYFGVKGTLARLSGKWDDRKTMWEEMHFVIGWVKTPMIFHWFERLVVLCFFSIGQLLVAFGEFCEILTRVCTMQLFTIRVKRGNNRVRKIELKYYTIEFIIVS